MQKYFYLVVFTIVVAAGVSAQQTFNPDSITIVRDKWGVPHIYGKTDADVAYGLAWANAEDNFEDMQHNLLQGLGRLGMAKGKEGAIRDYLAYSIRVKDIVDARYETDITPEFKRYLQGYAAGINAYAKAHPKEVIYKKVFPIGPKDILTNFTFTNSLISFVHHPIQKIIAGKYDEESVPWGSNGFAFKSNKTTDGSTYLACNPHQPFEGQMSFYEAHLCSDEGMNVLGALFPGGSSVFIGSNENLGWTHTFNGLDLVDTYKLKMHPKKKYYYEYDGKWEKLDVRTAWLKVKIKGFVVSVPKKTYWSKYGATFQSGKNKKEFYSVRFTANQDIRAAQQWYYMDKAKDFNQFKTALKDIGIVRFNIVYADRDDNIFYISNGRIPVRPKGYNWGGIVPGNTSKTLWTETYPLDSLPQLLNPSCGYVYNTNNSEFYATGNECNEDSMKFCRDMGFWYGNNNRAYRAFELVEKQEKFTWDEFKVLKFDQSLPASSKFFKSLKPMFMLDTLVYPDLAPSLRKLNNWNRSCAIDNKDAALGLTAIKYIFKKHHYGQVELETGINFPDSVFANALRYSRDHLMKNFNSIDIPLGDVQRLQRGNVDMPVGGAPDVLAALHTEPLPNGREKAVGGDTYVQLVRFTKTGLPHIESLLPLGNSARPNSPHFTDQMDLYIKQQTKVMTLDKATIFKEAERIYNPK